MKEVSWTRCVSRDCILRIRGYEHFEDELLEGIRRIRMVPIEHRSTSREHMRRVDLRDLFEVQIEASGQLMIKWRSMLTSSIQSKCSRQEGLLVSLWVKDQILWGPRRISLLKRICTNTDPRLFNRSFVWLGVLGAVTWESFYTRHALVLSLSLSERNNNNKTKQSRTEVVISSLS